MAFDGIVTRSVVKELKEKLVGLNVNRIYQVEDDEINILFRNYKLLISNSGNIPRIYLTEESKENPKTPYLFAMVLRKHLSGALVKDIVQYGNDRVIEIKFDAWDDFSEKTKKSLIVEIMGRHSNIILVDENKTIIDSITRVSEAMSRVRQIQPHLDYEYLPDETKLEPMEVSKNDVKNLIENTARNTKVSRFIFSSFTGFSKGIGIEIAERANVDSDRPISSLEKFEGDRLIDEIYNFILEIKNHNYSYNAYLDEDKIVDFHVMKLYSLEGLKKVEFSTPSEMLDKVYSKRDKDDRLRQKSQSLRKKVSGKLDKDKSKLSNLKRDLSQAEDRDKYRVYGDVLSANFHKVNPGDTEIKLKNFYSEEGEDITIPLDEKISPPQNAQKFYKKYSKLKTAEKILKEQIAETESEIEYLDSVLSYIDMAEEVDEIDNIKDELIEENYIKRNKKNWSRKKPKKEFRRYEKDGYKIYVGRNNIENDLLTHKEARRDDLWLHAQGIPGSHVIIKTNGKDDIPEYVIKYGAELAAYYSKARNSGSVDVDYTKKQNVKRHPMNKPGLVNYTDFDTILVESDKIENKEEIS